MKEGARQEPGFRNMKIQSLAECLCPLEPVELGEIAQGRPEARFKQARGRGWELGKPGFWIAPSVVLGVSSPGSLRLCGKERPGSRSLKG